MKTAEIINSVCNEMGIAKADLAKKLGLYPSSFYRKLSNESMTLEELQRCFDVMGVTMELNIQYPNGNVLDSHANHEQLMDKVEILEKKIEIAEKTDQYNKKIFRELRTELSSAVGYTEHSKKHHRDLDNYLEKLMIVRKNMERTISYALGEAFQEEEIEEEIGDIEALKGKRVLLVDDNELNREIIKEILTDQGLEVCEADNGSKAISQIKENEPGYYQFVLMDIEMPEIDGYEATMRIRKLPNRVRANVPIIALTANAFTENKEKAAVVGMDAFLVKPVNTARLLGSLLKFL